MRIIFHLYVQISYLKIAEILGEGVLLFAYRRVVKSHFLMFQELSPKEKSGSYQTACDSA